MVRQIIGFVNVFKSGDPFFFANKNGHMNTDESIVYRRECGERLRATRRALGYKNIQVFADVLDITDDRLSSWERGVNLIPPQYVTVLYGRWGVTHDWIYRGDAGGLPHSLAIRVLTPAAQ